LSRVFKFLNLKTYVFKTCFDSFVSKAKAKAKSDTVDQVRSSRFTYSSQQKLTLKDRVLPVRQFAVHSSLK